MWDLPRPGLEPVSPALAGRFLTTEPTGKPNTTSSTKSHYKNVSTDEWIKKMWHIYTMEYYSAIKRNEIELFVVRWMDQIGRAHV